MFYVICFKFHTVHEKSVSKMLQNFIYFLNSTETTIFPVTKYIFQLIVYFSTSLYTWQSPTGLNRLKTDLKKALDKLMIDRTTR